MLCYVVGKYGCYFVGVLFYMWIFFRNFLNIWFVVEISCKRCELDF